MAGSTLDRLFSHTIVSVFALAAVVVLGWWLTFDPTVDFEMSVPGMDGRPDTPSIPARRVLIGEYFEQSNGIPSSILTTWPRFRGSNHDNTNSEAVALVSSLDDVAGRILWEFTAGEGHAGAAVANGRIYLLDYDEERQGDALRCLSLDDGRELWRRWYRVPVKRNHGISRTIPAVTERYLVSIGPECHVMCVDAISGDLLWGIDLVADAGAVTPLWYTGQCPLIDGDIAVIAVGGEDLLIGVDCATGEIVWRVPNPDGIEMSHSSVMMMDIHGRRTYVYCGIGGIVGVSAERSDTGRLLWRTTDYDARVIAPSPVYMGEGRILATAGYGAGSIYLQVERMDENWSVETIRRNRPNEGFACEQQTPIVIDGLVYGIMPKDGGALRNQFVCFDRNGDLVWSSGETRRFGLGPYMVADGMFLILDDDGTLHLAEAVSTEFRPISSGGILSGLDAWAPMALVEGRLIARDSRRVVCVDLRAMRD